MKHTKAFKLGALFLGMSLAFAVYANTTANNTGSNLPTPTAGILAPISTPPAPDLNVHGYVLMDANTGKIVASKNMDQRMAPASLTKLMTLYIISSALAHQQIHLSDLVTISKTAWKTGGSRMFIKVGTQVPVGTLIQGIIVDSGNDATMAMAEYLAGSADTFPALMNQQAQKLGMVNTHYQDPTGLPSPNHYSSPHDIALLAQAIIREFPQYYDWYKQKTFTYNNITQANRNHLLWRDPSVDGLKTGFTDDAGYCLVSSAVRNGTRLISVVMGAPTNNDRYDYSQQLLNYGFRFYHTQAIYKANTPLTQVKAFYGKDSTIPVGVNHDLSVTLMAGQNPDIKASMDLDKYVKAPVKKGDILGKVTVTMDGQVLESQPLIALSDNPKAGVFGRMFDGMSLALHKVF